MRKCLSLTALIFIVGSLCSAGNLDDITIGGDFRYRQESLSSENQPDRYRHNFRARLNARAKVNDYMNFKIQICTGSDDPLSTNQTLDSSFSSKKIWLDMAYAEALFQVEEGLTLAAGKMGSPFFDPAKTELVWDVKTRPEGLAAWLDLASFDNTVDWRWNLGLFILEERPADKNTYLIAGQTVISTADKNADLGWTFAAGIMAYTNMQGFPPLYDTTDSFGNTLDASGHYLYDYTIWTGSAILRSRHLGIPAALFTEIAYNSGADENNVGWTVGTQLGEIDTPGSWSLYYKLRKLEVDAVVNLFTDVSFRGNANDNLCHEAIAAFRPLDRFTVMATGHFWKNRDDGQLLDRRRFRLDMIVEF